MNSNPTSLLTALLIETGDGPFVARYSQQGLAALDFPRHGDRLPSGIKAANAVSGTVKGFHRLTTQALERVLAGRVPGKLPPLDLSRGTDFQQRVWNELRNIATGQSRTYGQIAQAIGRPKAVRAVGGACGANPIPVLIPCHRVLAANRKLGGFSGGLAWKKKLLEREAIELAGFGVQPSPRSG